MRLNKIKVMTLNIQNYHNFIKRKPLIVSLIKQYAPDIVALQEVRDDESKNKSGMNQAQQLNLDLGFKHLKFLPTMEMNKIKGVSGKPKCYEGLAILSRFPFSSDKLSLKKHKEDRYTRKILVAKIKIRNKEVVFFVVHFSPNDFFARLHAEETLSYAKKAIVLGDFNIKYPEEIKKLAKLHHYASSAEYEYISYPIDNCSYDYILTPKTFPFLSFECIAEEVSDHKALFAEINL
jgi:endonuclease/exonuclease/phosphatase family metal-dependent hydrolase